MTDESDEQIGQFLDVISYFLLIFAVIAIVVGAFIIFNTFSILVAQRSPRARRCCVPSGRAAAR